MKKILLAFTVFSTLLWSCDNRSPEDELPLISVEGGGILENSSPAVIPFTITLSKPYSEVVSVEYRTLDNSATKGEDYVAATGTASISPGETSTTIEVDIIDDDVREVEESFFFFIENPVNGTLSVLTALGIIQNDDTGFNFAGYESPISYPGYTLAWQDEFDGATVNKNDWTFEIGRGNNGWGNQELQYYREENTSIADGNLVIEAKQESFSGSDYTSSRLITLNKQSFQYGRIDIRAVLPKGQGLWPALWMLGANFPSVGWPACGEIDIMEMVGGNGKENTVHGTVHWDNNGSYANYGGSTTKSSGTFSDAYHVFSILWDETAIRWLVDDIEYHVIDITPASLSEFRQDFFFILNVAVGGTWPGSPDATTTFPQMMVVDYVRVFDKN